MKIGILGGTLDPIHLGHLMIAEEARWRLELAQVVFVPTGMPWLKADRNITSGAHRLGMIKLAIASNPHFTVSTVDLDRPGSSYSVDTIAALRDSFGAEAEFYFIVGLDALAGLPTWKEPARLIQMCHIVGVRRPGYGERDLHSLEVALPGALDQIILLDVPEIGISSTHIRARVARSLSIRYLIPEAVGEYIKAHGLYVK